MEEEARNILGHALSLDEPVSNLVDLALELFSQQHGIELRDHPVVTPHEMTFREGDTEDGHQTE